MLLVHGGGGKAFREWAGHRAQRGYLALAIDPSGNGPAGPLPDDPPDQADTTKFRDFGENEVRDMWTYHAVAAVLRGHAASLATRLTSACGRWKRARRRSRTGGSPSLPIG